MKTFLMISTLSTVLSLSAMDTATNTTHSNYTDLFQFPANSPQALFLYYIQTQQQMGQTSSEAYTHFLTDYALSPLDSNTEAHFHLLYQTMQFFHKTKAKRVK